MKRILIIVPLFAVFAFTAPAQAWHRRVEVQGMGSVSTYDNFFYAAVDSLARTVLARRLNGRITFRDRHSHLPEVYFDVDHTQYETIGQSFGAGGFMLFKLKRHTLWLRAIYWNDRPAVSVNDVVQTADVLWAGGAYGYYGVKWVLQMNGATTRVFRRRSGERDVRTYTVGGRIGYRGFGRWLEPEVGGGIGRQFVGRANWNGMRADFYTGLAVALTKRLQTRGRYRVWFQRYPDASAESSNFRRSDKGTQWTFTAKLVPASFLSFEFSYDHIGMDSSHPDQIFSTRSLSLGITLWIR